MRRRFRFAHLGILFALAVCACSGSPEVKPRRETHLQGAGATFPAVLYREWFSKFDAQEPEISIDYEPVGSGEGVKRVLDESADGGPVEFGASDNGLTEQEAKRARRGLLQVPTAIGMICLVYNLPGVENLRLSRETYAGIFLGNIRKWNDPLIARDNPDAKLPARDISLVVRSDGSGTTYHFTNHLSAISPEWREKFGARRLSSWPARSLARRGNEGVGGEVKRSPGTIGYVDLGTKIHGKLNAVVLQNAKGEWIDPSPTHARRAFDYVPMPDDFRLFLPDPQNVGAYPIVGLTFVMLHRKYDDPKVLQAVRKLFEWCLTEGQHDCERLGYVPLSGSSAQAALKALRGLGN